MAYQEYESFSGKLDAAPEFEPFSGALDGENPKEPGFAARLGQGASRALDSAKTALTDDRNEIAKIAADQARTALPQTALQRKMAEEYQPYVDAANKAEGVVDNVKAWGAAGFKRAGQLLSNPAETGRMMAEQLPNSLPGLAGGFAGMKAGAALGSMVAPGPGTMVGGVLGGIAGGFAGGYGLEKGAAVQEQVQKEAQKRGIDIQDQAAVAGMVGENYDEIEATAQRKGVGTAGTDAILNVATMGLAGVGGRAIAKEAQALHAAVKSGAMDAAEASTRLAALESAQAARNTLGAKALRGTGVVGAEMVGEGLSEAAGQQYAYGQVDAGQVIDESLLGLGSGGAMALGSKTFNKAAGIVDQDATTQRLAAASAEIERQQADTQPQQSAEVATTNAGSASPDAPPLALGNTPDPLISFPDGSVGRQSEVDKYINDLPEDQRVAARAKLMGYAPQPVQRPHEAMGLDPAAGPLSRIAVQAVDSGAYMPPAGQAPATAPEPDPVVLQNRDRTSAASIAQMQEIAANPDYLRVGPSRDMTSGAPVVFGELPPTALLGRPETVVDGHGQRMGTQYAVVDALDLIASNNADGTTVAEYATGAPGKLRSVAGNGRTAGLQAAYQMGTAQRYRQELAGDAAALGVDAQALATMQRPVLVRVMQGADVTRDMGDRTNITATQKLSPLEQAGNDARRLDVGTLAFDEGGNPTPDSIKGFVSAMPVAERGDMLNPDGTPTRQAVDRLMAATFKQAYESDELVQLYAQATDPDARAVMAAAADASGVLANLKGAGEFDVRGAVADAAKMAVNAARQGLKLSDVLQNQDLDMSPEAYPVAAYLAQHIRTPKKMAEGLRRWGQLALEQARIADENTHQGSLLGPRPTLSRPEIFARLGSEANPTGQGIAPAAPAPQPAPEQAALVPAPQSPQSNPNGEPNGPQADQAQQAAPQQSEAPAQATAAAVARHPTWRQNAIQAGRVALALGLEPKGKRLAQIVAEIDARDSEQNQVVAPANPAQAATENVALDALERKTDEVMANVVAPGSINLTRGQVRALIQEKGVAAADKAIADYQEHIAKQAESIRKYSDRKEAASQSRQAQAATENVAIRSAKDEIPGESSALAAKQRWEQAKADEAQQAERDRMESDKYNAYARKQEFDAERRRLQGDRTIQQASGKPFKTEASAKAKLDEFDLGDTHAIRPVDGGFVLRDKREGRESYTQAQAAVLADMGIGENADGEIDATEPQWAEIERRIAERLGRKPAEDATQQPAPIAPANVQEGIAQARAKRKPKTPEALASQAQAATDSGADAQGAGAMFSRAGAADQTQTEAFKRWFAGSKVVDADGKPLAMYHGTSGNEGGDAFTYFDAYASNYGLMGQGAYFTADPEVASSYTTKGKGNTPTVYKVFLSIQNPIDMDAKADPAKWQAKFDGIEDFHEGGDTNESWYRAAEDLLRDQALPMWEGAEAMQDGLRAMGHDGITHIGGGRVKSDGVRHRVYIAFEPTQVKSATGNNGEFDGTNSDIRFSRAQQPMSPDLARAILALGSPPKQATKESVRAAVRELVNGLGLLPNRLGRIVVATSAEIKQDWEPLIGPTGMEASGDAGRAQGFYDPKSKTVFLIADNIRQGDELGVVAHELMHKHGPAVLGEEGWNRLHGALGGWAKAKLGSMERIVYDEAARRVQASGPELSTQELFPYAVQVALEMGVRPNAVAPQGTVERWLGQVRAALRTVWEKITRKPELFKSQDLVNLAFGIAQRENLATGTSLDALGASVLDVEGPSFIELNQMQGRPDIDARPSTQSKSTLPRDGLGAGSMASGGTVPSLDRPTRQDSTERGGPAGAGGVGSLAAIPSADNIQFSRAAPTANPGAAGWAAPSASQWDDFVYKLQDKHIDTKRVLESIRATGKAIADDLDVYLQEELYHGRAAKRTQDFVSHELEPLMKYMADSGLKMQDVQDYLHARHAKEANRVVAQRNPGLPDGGSGITDAEADAVLASFNAIRRAQLERAAARVDAMIAGTRQAFVEYGLESQDTVDAWAKTFAHYVPLMREQDGDGMAGLGTGQGFSIKGREVKGRTGSTRKVVDILANIAMQRERAIVRGEKNRVAAALVGFAKDNPSALWQVDVVPTRQTLDKKTGMVTTQHDPLYKQRDNVVVAKIPALDKKTGKVVVKEHAVVFNEGDARAMRMATALKNLDAPQLEGLLGATAQVTRYLAAINTQYNPIFGVTNLARDVQGAALNLSSTPLAGKQREVLGQALSALAGIYSDERARTKGKGGTQSQWAQLWEEFQSVGGQTGYRDQFRTSADRGQALAQALDPSAWTETKWGQFFTAGGRLKVPMEMARKAMAPVFAWLDDYNTAMENGVRLAAYKTARDAGMSKERAASLAKNLTTNFNRKGQSATQVGALYAFFNASVQGTARIGQTLFDMDPGQPKTLRLSSVGKKIVAGGVLLGSMQALLLAAMGFDDEEPPDHVRERNLVIPDFVFGSKKYLTIPMPLGFHVLPNLGRIPAEFALSGFSKPAEHVLKLVGLFSDTFNPIGNAGLSMQTLAPTVLDPLAALAENKDFSGRAIAKESFNKMTPGHALARDTASLPALWLAEGINYLTGGTRHVRGALSPTPDQIDYLVGQVTGGVGREATKAMQTAQATASGDDLPAHKVPLLGRFYGNADSQSAKQAAFYRHLDEVARHAEQVKGLRLEGKGAEALAYAQEHPQARLHMAARAAQRQIKDMRERRRELEQQGASREEVRALEQRMTQRMERFNALAA